MRSGALAALILALPASVGANSLRDAHPDTPLSGDIAERALWGSEPPPRLAFDPEDRAGAGQREYRRNYLIPAIEVPSTVILLNMFDRWVLQKSYAQTRGFETFFHHVAHESWAYDHDSIWENFVGHPYMGGLFYSYARSSGLDFYTSFGYSFLGSLLWVMGGEIGKPSINDQVTTPTAGSFVGEALYRLHVLLLQLGGDTPGFWPEIAAFLVNPPAGFNRLLFGDTYQSREFDEHPWFFAMLSAGGGFVWHKSPLIEGREPSGISGGASLDMTYWLPRHTGVVARPFDVFTARVGGGADPEGFLDTVQISAIIAGQDFKSGSWTGVGGLVGSYDDINIGIFRVGSVDLGLGTMGQFDVSKLVALELRFSLLASLMAGSNSRKQPYGGVDHHLGPGGAQGMLDLRLHLGERAMINLGAREFIVVGQNPFPGWEDQTFARLAAYLRIIGPHALGATLDIGRRSSRNPGIEPVHQHGITLGIAYTFTSDRRFGALPHQDSH